MGYPGVFHRMIPGTRLATVLRSGVSWVGFIPGASPDKDIWVHAAKADEAMRLINATLVLQVTE